MLCFLLKLGELLQSVEPTLLTLLTSHPDRCVETPLVPPLSFRVALCSPSVVPHCEPPEARPPRRRNARLKEKNTGETHNDSVLSELNRWRRKIHASPRRHRAYYETMLSLLCCLSQNKLFHPRGKVNSSCS